MESVVWRQTKTKRSIRTVNSAGLAGTERTSSSNACRRSERISHRREAESRKHIDDWCNRPSVEDRSTCACHVLEIGVVNNTRNELMTPVKRRQTVITRRIERIKERRETRGERCRTLRAAVVLRPRQGIAALELHPVCQTSIRLQHECMVFRRDAVANLEDVAKTRIRS